MLRAFALIVSGAVLLASCGGAPSQGDGPTRPADPSAEVPSSATTDRYRVALGAADPSTLAVTLWLAPGGGAQQLDLPEAPGRESRRGQIIDVRCGDIPVAPAGNGWDVSGDCSVVHYTVQLTPVATDEGVSAAGRQAIVDVDHGQWLLVGDAVFLVPQHTVERPTLELRTPTGMATHHQLPQAPGLGVALPPWPRIGHVVIGLGSFREHRTQIGSSEVRHFVDDQEASFDSTGLADGFSFLVEKLAAESPGNFDVYWLARPTESGRLSGSTGQSALVLNHYRDVDEGAHRTLVHAPAAVFFQQVFALLTRHLIPEWMALSLGQYYALRAWVASELVTEADVDGIVRSATPRRGPDGTVLSLYRQWQLSGGDADWSALVRLGLAFWATLDAHLRANESSLDALLPELTSVIYRRDGTPPQRFLELLQEAGGEATPQLLTRWLGWPESG